MFRKKFSANWSFSLLAAAVAILITLSFLGYAQPSHAALPNKSAIKDARILLRNALPMDNELIRQMQDALEQMPRQANLKRWRNLSSDIDDLLQKVAQQNDKLLASVPSERKASAEIVLFNLNKSLVPLKEAIAAKDRNSIRLLTEKALEYISMLEAQMVTDLPFRVPDTYANLPQLQGRAVVEMQTERGNIIMVLDGYSAPVNAGQFADLVQRGFYDGLTFNRADNNYFLQAGDPPGKADGFVDPKTSKVRTVPIEVRVPGKAEPIYGHTLGEVGLSDTLPVLPFSAYGTVAMAHPGNDPNGGSSQFFLYLFESELTPAGLNLIDGNYTVFGYVIEGEEILHQLKLGDKILSARIVSGAENLVQPKNT